MEKKESFSQVIQSDKPTLVDFHATWCGPCKTQAPILNEVSTELGDTARILKIDVDKNQAIAGKFDVRGVPTLIIFKNGEVKWRSSGVKMKHELVQLLRQYS